MEEEKRREKNSNESKRLIRPKKSKSICEARYTLTNKPYQTQVPNFSPPTSGCACAATTSDVEMYYIQLQTSATSFVVVVVVAKIRVPFQTGRCCLRVLCCQSFQTKNTPLLKEPEGRSHFQSSIITLALDLHHHVERSRRRRLRGW